MEKDVTLNENIIKEAIDLIKKKHFEKAIALIGENGQFNSSPCIINNLMGIIHEMQGDIDTACDFYRASLIFDASYEPADNNLANITRFDYSLFIQNIDFGLESNLELTSTASKHVDDENEFYIDFSNGKSGKLRRRT